MSTRSLIGYQTETGKLRVVYCHCNGSPKGVGKKLLENYNSLEKIKAIVELGSLSWLGDSIEVPENCITKDLKFIHKDEIDIKSHWDQEKSNEFYNTHSYFYGRDRGEKTNIKAKTFDNIKATKNFYGFIDYIYIYKDNKINAFEGYFNEIDLEKIILDN